MHTHTQGDLAFSSKCLWFADIYSEPPVSRRALPPPVLHVWGADQSAGCLQVPDTERRSFRRFKCDFFPPTPPPPPSRCMRVWFKSRSRTWSLMPWATHRAMWGGMKIEEGRGGEERGDEGGGDRWVCSRGRRNKRTTIKFNTSITAFVNLLDNFSEHLSDF